MRSARFGRAGVALWWFGENFVDIAPYIDDAGTGELPLLGGNMLSLVWMAAMLWRANQFRRAGDVTPEITSNAA